MGTFFVLLIVGCGLYKLCQASPKILRFAAENGDACRSGGAMLKRMFSR